MRIFSALLFSTILSAAGAACVGTAPSSQQQQAKNSQFCVPTTVDSDGDGIIDGIDTNCDGVVDIPICAPKLIDTNGDGIPDGLDTNCDGSIDIPLPGSGGGGSGSGSAGSGSAGSGTSGGGSSGGGTSTSQCSVDVSVNGQEEAITCTSTNGGPEQCTCKLDGAVTSTCTTTSDSACSLPGNGNCCGF